MRSRSEQALLEASERWRAAQRKIEEEHRTAISPLLQQRRDRKAAARAQFEADRAEALADAR